MTQFCLVRHGQTDWNLAGRYQGHSDVPLNESGRGEACALAIQLQNQLFSAVYTSDLQRARETAQVIAAALRKPVTVDRRLREIDLGEWEGQLAEFIKHSQPELWQLRRTDPAAFRPPGGETVGEVAERVYAVLDEIARQYPNGNVLIVSHGLTLAAVICRTRGDPPGQAYQVYVANAEPVWVDWEAN
jgi:broad specificity phosphatase PhoE